MMKTRAAVAVVAVVAAAAVVGVSAEAVVTFFSFKTCRHRYFAWFGLSFFSFNSAVIASFAVLV
jgi:hypothetical protein